VSERKQKLRIHIEPDDHDWVLRHGLWDIGVFSDYKAAILEAIRMAQRRVDESEVFIHNRVGQQFLVWQSRMG
jgi:hypothetical protein